MTHHKGPGILIFSKIPSLVACKTRLADTSCLSPKECQTLQLAFLIDTLQQAEATGLPTILASNPEISLEELKELSQGLPHPLEHDFTVFPQAQLEFAPRLEDAAYKAHQLFDAGIIILGSDSPLIPKDLLLDVATHVSNGSAVLGPTGGAGLYCIGLPKAFFVDHGSMTPGFGARTELEGLSACLEAYNVHLLPPHFDVDIAEDLLLLYALLNCRSRTSALPLAQNTRVVLERMKLEVVRDPVNNRNVELRKIQPTEEIG